MHECFPAVRKLTFNRVTDNMVVNEEEEAEEEYGDVFGSIFSN